MHLELSRNGEIWRLFRSSKHAIFRVFQAYETKQFVIECTETITWIKEKAKLIQDTEALGNDLTAVIALQRRLAGMERDLSAIEGKIRGLTDEADRLCAEVSERKIGSEFSNKYKRLRKLFKRSYVMSV